MGYHFFYYSGRPTVACCSLDNRTVVLHECGDALGQRPSSSSLLSDTFRHPRKHSAKSCASVYHDTLDAPASPTFAADDPSGWRRFSGGVLAHRSIVATRAASARSYAPIAMWCYCCCSRRSHSKRQRKEWSHSRDCDRSRSGRFVSVARSTDSCLEARPPTQGSPNDVRQTIFIREHVASQPIAPQGLPCVKRYSCTRLTQICEP